MLLHDRSLGIAAISVEVLPLAKINFSFTSHGVAKVLLCTGLVPCPPSALLGALQARTTSSDASATRKEAAHGGGRVHTCGDS